MNAGVLLEVRDLAVKAGGLRAGRTLFESLSLDVRAGECWVVLGRNGAGKSSLLAALAGVFARSSGAVEVGAQRRYWSAPDTEGRS